MFSKETLIECRQKNIKKTAFGILTLVYFPLSIIYMEIVFRALTIGALKSFSLLYIFLFSIVIGLLFTLLSTFFSERANKWVSRAVLLLVFIIFAVQIVYYHVFKELLIFYSFNVGTEILQFKGTILRAIWEKTPAILLLSLPLVIHLAFGRKFIKFSRFSAVKRVSLAAIAAVIHIITVLFVLWNNSGTLSPRVLYRESFVPKASVEKFGLLTTSRLEVKFLLFGHHDGNIDDYWDNIKDKEGQSSSEESSDDGSASSESEDGGPQETEPKKKYNIMDIDFSSLISKETDNELLSMHKYFSSQTPSEVNEYTGLFEGKNLIFITAEGFSPYVIDKELTPTLYKMQEEGIKFTNFYTPSWGVSTSDGEYVACTGLIPKSGVWSFSKSSKNYLPFCMGNQFKNLGIESFAYHNNTYTYYNRHLSHPNMGYIYKGLGKGLEVARTWPESDLEMIDLSVKDFVGKERFHAYYMTVSGHMLYTFKDNYMAYKNRNLVAHLPYSDNVKAYLACNIELELAMKRLLEILKEAGVADDTVIVISPDHYPYGLTNEEIAELAGHEVETNFELYKGVLLVYCQGMDEPIVVDEPASSLDIIPTISNLFGLEFDSRLLMGQDIFSSSPPLVIFYNRSWISDKGRFNAAKGRFEPNEGVTVPENYVKYINDIINYKFKMSQKILEKDYYRVILQN